MGASSHVRCACVVLAMGLLTPTRAGAGHGATPVPPRAITTGEELGSSVGMDISTSTFDTDFGSGSFWTVAVTGELWTRGGVGVRLRLPVHTLTQDGGRASGIGDVTVGARAARSLTRSLRLELVLDLAIPTGDAETGLGIGVAGITSGAQLAQAVAGGVELLGVVSGRRLFGEGGTRTFVDMRSDLELYAGTGVAWSHRATRLAAIVGATRVLAPESSAGRTFITAMPSVAVDMGAGLWARAFAELPLSTQRRLGWQAGIGLIYNWNRAEDPEAAPHTHTHGAAHVH